PEFARTLLAQKVFNPSIRNNIQDLLWADEPIIDIPKRHRRELAEALQPFELFGHWENFKRLLNDLFVFPLDLSEIFSIHETGILGEIHRHFVRNPEDGDVAWLFEKLQIVELSAPRFRRWLEGLVSADVQISIERQLAKVEAVNKVLRTCGAELIHSSDAEGYPVFSLISLRTFRGRPKNIIFASLTKPDIRLSDSLNNEIEILSNSNEVLIYDRPLSSEGLSWRELQAWWADFICEENSEEAKISLYRRLQQSLPNSSPPQKKFFKEFFRQYRSAIYDLPALLPEVWLHWDPKTVSERGAGALLNHRMD
ncbi:AbiJ-related protein, partial [Klebsiella variicola]|uniref:AbiJ-related protein n=2 Tax=Klebsiella TaxID=570 RepID=UPI0010F5EA04